MLNRELAYCFSEHSTFAVNKKVAKNKTQEDDDSNGKPSSRFFEIVILETLLLDFSQLTKWILICTAIHDGKEVERFRSTGSVKGVSGS